VHNYQRYERKAKGRKIPYVVAGAGGYAGYTRLHQLKTTHHPNPAVHLKAHNTDLPGFLTLTITDKEAVGEYFVVPKPPQHLTGAAKQVDSFTVKL